MSISTNKLKQQMIARKRRLEAARLQRRRKRPAEWSGGTFPIGPIYRFEASSGVKMYEVLEEFVEPFAAEVEGLEEYRRLLCVGQLAWNAALCSEPERGAMVRETLSAAMAGADRETLAAGRVLVETLIARKERHFADLQRSILAFDLQDIGDGWYLNAVSARAA